jgi:hypothetical protein
MEMFCWFNIWGKVHLPLDLDLDVAPLVLDVLVLGDQ